MIVVTCYSNGFEINGHAEKEICYQISILAWFCGSSIGTVEKHDYYTSDYDDSSVGYTHLTFDRQDEKSVWMFDKFKEHLKAWSEHYEWDTNGHVEVVEKNEELRIPHNFKELKGIA